MLDFVDSKEFSVDGVCHLHFCGMGDNYSGLSFISHHTVLVWGGSSSILYVEVLFYFHFNISRPVLSLISPTSDPHETSTLGMLLVGLSYFLNFSLLL